MPRQSSRSNTPVPSTPRRSLGKPLLGPGQVVQRLRARQFAGCRELPDVVIRTTASKAEKTRESIRYNYFSWKRWLAMHAPGMSAFPAQPAQVARYLQYHAPPILESRSGGFEVEEEGMTAAGRPSQSHATLQRFLAVIATLHREAGNADPTRHPEVVAIWRVLRRGLRRSRQKARLGLQMIWSVAGALPPTTEGKRDRAILLLAYALMARRSELVALNDTDLERHEDGSMTVRFQRRKTRAQAEILLPYTVADILEDWLVVRPTRAPAVFVRLDRAGNGERLDAGSIATIMRRAVGLSGLVVDAATIGSHSARIGAAYDLALAGAPDSAIMRDGGWKTQHMVVLYTRGARAREGALAKLLSKQLQQGQT